MFLEKFRLDGKAALVTGGSRGLGLEAALALKEAGAEEVEVEEARTPWSTEAMTEEAREKLLGYGVAPPLPLPMAGEDPPCPRCGSREVVLKNPFGATLCKTLYQCAACGEVFEAFKTV